jgi:hypothetical protein
MAQQNTYTNALTKKTGQNVCISWHGEGVRVTGNLAPHYATVTKSCANEDSIVRVGKLAGTIWVCTDNSLYLALCVTYLMLSVRLTD